MELPKHIKNEDLSTTRDNDETENDDPDSDNSYVSLLVEFEE